MKKVIVAMSGGVDSSVAAALLKSRGYDVSGVFMKFWSPKSNDGRENKCCSLDAKLDAKRVAMRLDIPFYVINAQKEFKKKVVDYFINEYKKGNTPNPCVECNRHIKFKILLDKAIELGADYIATGHYAKIKSGKLMVAKDKQKDQSYFLWQLNQKQLDRVLFPLGDYTKDQVRLMAKKFRLSVYRKPDSQEVCFINTRIHEFLSSRIHTNKGPMITNDGKIIGEHKGLIFYTIGQRKGIEIGGIGPFYVVKKDFEKNALIVSKSEKDLLRKEMVLKNINWLSGKSYFGKCKVKIRSTAKIVGATIKGNKIVFKQPQRAITSGQSAVIYKDNQLIGGGIII